MSELNFLEGDEVEYKGMCGTICFVNEAYISLCVSETVQNENIHKSCQCRIVIYPEQWHEIVEISDWFTSVFQHFRQRVFHTFSTMYVEKYKKVRTQL